MIIPVESSLSDASESPVQNKVIKAKFDSVENLIDDTASAIRGETPYHSVITNDTIDSICDASIVVASEALF